MVYYLTLLPCACIGIVGASRMLRRSASAKEQLHHPRGKHGREDGRRRSYGVYSGRTTDVPPDVRHSIAVGRPTTSGRPTSTNDRTTDADRTTDTSCPEPKRRKSDALWTFGPPRATGRPTLPVRSRAFGLVSLSHLPLRVLDYK